jgi:hypothetical protein
MLLKSTSKLLESKIDFMERLGQCHLRTLLEHPRLTRPASKRTQALSVGYEHSSKELSIQLIRKIYISSRQLQQCKIAKVMILVLKKDDIDQYS